MNTIEKINGRWLVNKKPISECYGYEVDFFLAFLKFMKFPKEEVRKKTNGTNKKIFNYKYLNNGTNSPNNN